MIPIRKQIINNKQKRLSNNVKFDVSRMGEMKIYREVIKLIFNNKLEILHINCIGLRQVIFVWITG